jgi:hypothetical protein
MSRLRSRPGPRRPIGSTVRRRQETIGRAGENYPRAEAKTQTPLYRDHKSAQAKAMQADMAAARPGLDKLLHRSGQKAMLAPKTSPTSKFTASAGRRHQAR